jgi:hypothetical protein
MIYQLTTGEIIPGKMTEYYSISNKELQPLYPKMGMKLVGSFHSYTGNMNQIYALYVFDDLAALQKTREKQKTDVDYQRVAAKLNPFRINLISTLLEPNAWSPMK